jgi:hypothetical protein
MRRSRRLQSKTPEYSPPLCSNLRFGSALTAERHGFQLDSVRIREEDRVIARRVLGIRTRSVQDSPSSTRDIARESIDLLPSLGVEGYLTQADAILRERIPDEARVRLFDPKLPPAPSHPMLGRSPSG